MALRDYGHGHDAKYSWCYLYHAARRGSTPHPGHRNAKGLAAQRGASVSGVSAEGEPDKGSAAWYTRRLPGTPGTRLVQPCTSPRSVCLAHF